METAISTPIAINADAIRLLKEFYPDCAEGIPPQRQKSQWLAENKLGFFMGLINYGIDTHINELLQLLQTGRFQEQQLFKEQTFIDRMFEWYILPFHKNYNENSCSSRSNSRPSSAAKEEQQEYQPKELSHKDLKEAVEKRDGVCLFCWDMLECEGAHIIAQKNFVTFDEPNILMRAGLSHKHLVQNGLLLCIKCHSQFDKLKRYVDVVEDKLVVKVVNETDDEIKWLCGVERIKNFREVHLRVKSNMARKDGRQAAETNGEIGLYFINNDVQKQPNRKALEYHKTACLIWRMAGGAESDYEFCSDDDEDLGKVDTAALKRRFNIQDSSDTLNDRTTV